MITLGFFLTSISLTVLLAIFDMKIFEYPFLLAVKNIIFSEIAAGRYIVILGGTGGLVSSVIIDVRLYLQKKRRNGVERNQGS
ncbi:hypothetical protein HPT25_14895 [Bacillus sp. BRMEA1]|uniref:hypothetical protein n=1 Tax=Neobacillus endophyticus TaxID=2738405 RepID=UPI0015649D8B|nr:hypothetical protein [Neobacillus endophyticus]NRD78646.1 hypothetical protein [Neobacillus endophyticus]